MNDGVIKRGLQETIDSQSVTDGKIYLAVDTCRMFVDTQNERIEITDFVQGLTYDEITALEHPLQKLYLSIDTHQLLAYDFANNEWVTYSGGALDPTVLHDMQQEVVQLQNELVEVKETLSRYERIIEIIEQEHDINLDEPEEPTPDPEPETPTEPEESEIS